MVCHLGTRFPRTLHSPSAPACKPRVRTVNRCDYILLCWLHHASLFCCRLFLFYCTYLISCRSSGPKHTRIREMIFHWSLLAPLFETDYWNIPLSGGIWRYPCHTAVLSPLLSARGRHRHTFFAPPTKEFNRVIVHSTAQYQYKQSSTALPEQTGNNFWPHL